MDRALLVKRVEIIVGVFLIVVVVLGILFFLFRSIPLQTQIDNTQTENLSENIVFLDLSGQKDFTVGDKKVVLPGEDTVLSAYNNYSSSPLSCIDSCTIYEIQHSGRVFYMSSPSDIQLKDPTSISKVTKTLSVSGEESVLTYTQIKFVMPITEDGVETTQDLPEQTQIEEIYFCLQSKVCFSSGKLSEEKATNDLDVAAFEEFVEAIVVE